MADVRLATTRGELPAHLATPSGAGPWPGVVVIHEAFGLNDDVRGIAQRLAQHGYLALAPDFFAWGTSRLACVRAAFQELRAGAGRMFDDLDAARGWLGERADCTGRVGVIGFCMGGGFALLAAPRPGVRGRQRELRPGAGRRRARAPGRLPDRGVVRRARPRPAWAR